MGFSKNAVVFFLVPNFQTPMKTAHQASDWAMGLRNVATVLLDGWKCFFSLSHPQVIRMIWDTPPVLSHLDMEMYDVDVKLIEIGGDP